MKHQDRATGMKFKGRITAHNGKVPCTVTHSHRHTDTDARKHTRTGRTSPVTLMMYRLGVRLHTSSRSLCSGRNTTVFTAVSVTRLICGGRKERMHSVVLTSQIYTRHNTVPYEASRIQQLMVHGWEHTDPHSTRSKRTFTLPSLLPVATMSQSWEYLASFTYEVWPRNSFSDLPDFRPWILDDNNSQHTQTRQSHAL